MSIKVFNYKNIKNEEYKNKLQIKFTTLINKIYLTKDKKYIDKSQLKIIKQFFKIIMNNKNKNLFDKEKIYEIITIINKKQTKFNFQTNEIEDIFNDIENLNKIDKVNIKKSINYSYKNKNSIYYKFLFFYTKKIIQLKNQFDSNKNYDLMKERAWVELEYENKTKYFIKNLYYFWFPYFQIITNVKNINLENLKIYIFLKIPFFINDIKNNYYKYYKREHIFKIIVAYPWSYIRNVDRYSRYLIIYSKRSLGYYNVIVNTITGYKYPAIEINLNTKLYKNTIFYKNLVWIFNDIKLRLIYGYYDKYVIVSLLQLNEIYLDPQYLKPNIFDQLNLNTGNINLILLTDNLPFNYFWI